MITDPMLAPRNYDEATEDNPLRFGVNAEHFGYWYTNCDGMPTPMGCGSVAQHPRPYVKFGPKRKQSGWLLIHGADDDGKPDRRTVLAFCPSCADVVEAQEAARRA